MSRPSFPIGLVAAGLVAAMMAAPAPVNAETFDNLAYLSFSGPVQVPGHTTLGAGTYRFRLANADSGRNVIQVLSNDGFYVYGMYQTIPDYRSIVTDEATVTFMEVPAGVAPPIKSVFYGGESHGYELVYGKGEPNMTPPPVKAQPPIAYEPSAPHAALTPAPATEPVAPSYTPEPAAKSEPLTAPSVGAVGEPATLPATATRIPAVAFGGFATLLLGLGVGLLRRRR